MSRFDGSLARQLDFGDITTSTFPRPRTLKAGLKLTERLEGVRGAAKHDKYKVLEHRRRQAQIAARRLLDSL
jgi:hypothetical protein